MTEFFIKVNRNHEKENKLITSHAAIKVTDEKVIILK